jgi:hypothetical protein
MQKQQRYELEDLRLEPFVYKPNFDRSLKDDNRAVLLNLDGRAARKHSKYIGLFS